MNLFEWLHHQYGSSGQPIPPAPPRLLNPFSCLAIQASDANDALAQMASAYPGDEVTDLVMTGPSPNGESWFSITFIQKGTADQIPAYFIQNEADRLLRATPDMTVTILLPALQQAVEARRVPIRS